MNPELERDDAGLTLVEIMIAGGILAMSFVFLLGSIVSISSTGESSENRSKAQTDLSTVLEEVRSVSYDQLLAYVPPELPGLGDSVNVEVVCLAGGGVEYELPIDADLLAAPLPNPVEVRVTVSWLDRMGRVQTARASALAER